MAIKYNSESIKNQNYDGDHSNGQKLSKVLAVITWAWKILMRKE